MRDLTPAAARTMLSAMDAAGTPDRGKRVRPVLLIGLLALLAVLVVAAGVEVSVFGLGTSGGTPIARSLISQDRAEVVARKFYEGSHAEGAKVANVVIKNVISATSKAGRPIWRVEIFGTVTEQGSTDAYVSAMWLAIDAETQAVTIEAQG